VHPTAPPATDAVASELFDYVGFEQRFRGDFDEVRTKLQARYLDVLRDAGPVLDIGCGRGEMLQLLADNGIDAYGIDLDANVVADAAASGLEVRRGDALAHLESVAPGSLGAIVSTQVVEHLEFGALLRLLDLAVTRLRPGGVFIAETPNPASLIVLAYSYILDPTHVRPLHPSLMSFLCEAAGYRDIQVRFFSPAEHLWLAHVDGDGSTPLVAQVNDAFDKLNAFLFGPQDYAVIARTPAEI
jgi:SAM-dependent methyltransferase